MVEYRMHISAGDDPQFKSVTIDQDMVSMMVGESVKHTDTSYLDRYLASARPSPWVRLMAAYPRAYQIGHGIGHGLAYLNDEGPTLYLTRDGERSPLDRLGMRGYAGLWDEAWGFRGYLWPGESLSFTQSMGRYLYETTPVVHVMSLHIVKALIIRLIADYPAMSTVTEHRPIGKSSYCTLVIGDMPLPFTRDEQAALTKGQRFWSESRVAYDAWRDGIPPGVRKLRSASYAQVTASVYLADPHGPAERSVGQPPNYQGGVEVSAPPRLLLDICVRCLKMTERLTWGNVSLVDALSVSLTMGYLRDMFGFADSPLWQLPDMSYVMGGFKINQLDTSPTIRDDAEQSRKSLEKITKRKRNRK